MIYITDLDIGLKDFIIKIPDDTTIDYSLLLSKAFKKIRI